MMSLATHIASSTASNTSKTAKNVVRCLCSRQRCSVSVASVVVVPSRHVARRNYLVYTCLPKFVLSCLVSVHTTQYPYSRAANTRASNTGAISDTRVRGPCPRAPVHSTREHGRSIRPVNTGSVYQALIC